MALCVLLASCALTEVATPPTPTLAPRATSTPRVVPAPTNPEVVVPTFPPRVGTSVPNVAATSTIPAANGDPLLAFAQQFDGNAAYEYNRFLASKELAGRKAGAPGADTAADYIASKFKAAGLKPIGDNGTYFQNLTLPYIDLAEPPTLKLLNADGSVKKQYTHRVDFSEVISGRAGDGAGEGQLVFIGRATNAELDKATDLNGKIALMLPAPNSARNLVSALTAKGAVGLIQVVGNADSLQIRFSYITQGLQTQSTMAVLRVTKAVADDLLQGSGATLAELDERLNKDEAIVLPTPNRVSMSQRLVPLRDAATKNVLGALPGSDPALASEVLIVGGHYDHVGADPGGAIFFGANDNASGAAVVTALAEYFGKSNIKFKRTIVFAAWTGEEAGLVGSDYYVKHSVYPLAQTKDYVNLDVVGAGTGANLNLTEDSATLANVAKTSAKDLGVGTARERLSGGSDHESFLNVRVPSVFLIWEGCCDDLHKPSDTFDKIDVNKLKATGQVAALTLARLSEQ
jgi:peptidase M28-like protein